MGVNTVKTLLIAILFLAASAQAQQVPAYDPPAGSPVCYVSAFGNDANSGAWWDTAKASIMACFDVLPQGAYAGGTIYLQDKNGVSIPACPAGSPPGCGIWIMGPGDPNYASPPAGWRKKLGATPIYILGVGAASTAGSNKPQVSVTGGSNADAMHPSLWLSGATPVVVENVKFTSNTRNPIYLGVDSNGSSSDTATSVWQFLLDNVSAEAGNTVGYGPTLTLTTNAFWGFVHNCEFGGNPAEVAALSTLTRTANIVTATSTAALPSSWTGSMNAGIFGTTDASFQGAYTVAGSNQITVTGTNTFTYPNVGPNTSTTGGKASSDASQAVLINPGNHGGVGQINFRDVYFPGGGAMRVYSGSGSSFTADNIYSEAGFSPTIDLIGCASMVDVTNVTPADKTIAIPGFRIDVPPNKVCGSPAVVHNSTVDGMAHLDGNAGPSNPLVLPNTMAQSGIYKSRLFAQDDTSRRAFGPVVARWPNLASQNPASWGTGSCVGKIVGTPAMAPDGTMGAGQVSTALSSAGPCFYSAHNVQVVAGDTYAFGTWVQSNTANGPSNYSIGMGITGTGCANAYSAGYYPAGNGGLSPSVGGAGEWSWVSGWMGITSGGPSCTVTMYGHVDPTHTETYYEPVVIDIPASANIPANEIAEMALHLQGYRADATPGQVSVMSGEQFKADSIQVGPGIAPVITSGYGVPTVACVAPSGCLYLRLDGSAGATLYVFEGTAWTAK